ncbi:MAG: methylated-DNA--[protein]-cysteine S-methyltransferase [Thermoleophilia bacterium]
MDAPWSSRYATGYGEGTLVWRDGLLECHRLPGTAPATSGDPQPVLRGPAGPEAELRRLLEAYFRGVAVAFDLEAFPLRLEGISAFTLRVFRTLAATGPGEVISYASLAAAAGHPGAARAVGNAMAANPWPVIVPCHRVVRSDGGLGGFSCGVEWKQRLLELEGYRLAGGYYKLRLVPLGV